MTNTREKVEAILIDSLCITQADLDAAGDKLIFVNHESASPPANLGGDSLDWVEIVMACEDVFNLEIPDDDAEAYANHTVAGLVAYIDRRLAE